MGKVKQIAKRIVGEGNLGRLDFFRHPNMKPSWGGPFNGQKYRQCMFFDILYHVPIKAIVETGTFRGTTTALFAATSLPVYTVEMHHRSFYYAKMRFVFDKDSVHVYENDSRTFLRELSENGSVPKEDVFFYLDAHWGEDLPLREELEIIFSNWQRPIVMIDDFQVPDSSYAFDDYGPGKALTMEYIEPVVSAYKIATFFPAVSASEETGARRGSIVLCKEKEGIELETKFKTLVRGAHT